MLIVEFSTVQYTIRYGMEGSGFEFLLRDEIFLTCPHRPWGPRGLLYNGPGSFPGGKAAGAWR